MKRREFIKSGAVAAGMAGSLRALGPLAANASEAPPASANGPMPADNRPADFLRQVRQDRFLPPSPAAGRAYPLSPMSLAERVRRRLVPRHGFCSIAPAANVGECLISGNGAMSVELMGEPYAEQILFHHESLLMPWKRPLEAPQVADIFPQVRQMALDGNRDALSLALQHLNESPLKANTEPHLTVPAFLMQLDCPKSAAARNYLRTVNFDNGELRVCWTDERGEWLRETFVSRPDNLVLQRITAPAGRTMNLRVSLKQSPQWSMSTGASWGNHPARGTIKGPDAGQVVATPLQLVYKCRLDSSVDNSGYAGVTRVVCTGGTPRVDGDSLAIVETRSVVLLTRIEHLPDYSEGLVAALVQEVSKIDPDYAALLERHRKVQSEMMNRVTVNFGGDSQYGMSTEELLSDQRARADYSPALLEKVFAMGRHWFVSNSGKYPSMAADVNSAANLQMAGAVAGDLREGLEAYFNWMESLAADCRANAKNIFGFRGALYPLFPDKGMGVSFHYTGTTPWPYWISAGGWLLRPFWDHYLASGDREFLQRRVVPAYKELALFYEDFLTATDGHGNYVFAPSFSPENTPGGAGAVQVNATMDVAVCREVLTNLIQASELLGSDADQVSKWKAMLAKMPPYLLELDGTLKEWASPGLQERYSHRHVSHLYGAWPGDEIDPDRTPHLARAAEIACRRRAFDVMSTAVSGETLPAYCRCHRALVGARLKDNSLVDVQLRQLVEQGYVSTALRCSRDPYGGPVPDAQAGLPAIVMEMLAYSRPGVIEILPSLPASLVKGEIRGLLARSFARIDKLAWDMDARKVDLTITSLRAQDISLVARHGIEKIFAPAGVVVTRPRTGAADCNLRLPEKQPVAIQLTLGRRNPLDWAAA